MLGLTTGEPRDPHRAPPRPPVAAGSRAVALWLAATLVTLGTVAALSAQALGHHLVLRTDEEIEKYRGVQLSEAAGVTGPNGRPALDRSCLILVLDSTGRVTERYAGAPDLPSFPALAPARLAALAARGHPVGIGGTYRALVVRPRGPAPDRDRTYVVIARSMADAHQAVTRLLRAEAAASLVLLAAVACGARWLGGRAARQRLDSERRLREFLAAAGHELRNPLTTISGYAQLARVGHPSSERMREEAFGRMSTEVERMTSLIDELVLLSELDLGQSLRVRYVDLAELCRAAVTAARDCHPDHPVRLLVAPGEHTVAGDPLRLHQVVANLLANARTHTPPGTTTTLGLGTEGDHRVIEVTDDGPGVPDALRARIFDRFVRGEGASAGGGGSTGSGLGLSIVAAIAAAHGGTVTLEPSDRGAWFRVRLPAGP
ncbi:sensor histidine kinase [Streptomyces mirabilis]|uniref:sensor histidine kinase n=1 Tax=Streptomyces mirabilis TaxID=68239 RepID=UPI0036AD4DB5